MTLYDEIRAFASDGREAAGLVDEILNDAVAALRRNPRLVEIPRCEIDLLLAGVRADAEARLYSKLVNRVHVDDIDVAIGVRELKRIAVGCVERGNKQETEMPAIDELETEMRAIHLMCYWLDLAKRENRVQPLGPALAFARQADREKLTDRTAILRACVQQRSNRKNRGSPLAAFSCP